jgi:integrase
MRPTTHPAPRRAPPAQQQLELRDPGQPTLGEVATWYLRKHVEMGGMGLSTQRGYRSTLRMALEHFGQTAVPTVGEARAWLAHRLSAGEVSALTANSHRDRMHAVYTLYREQARAVTLNPFTFRRFNEDDRRHLKGEIPAGLWPRLLAAMPDDRARAALSLMANHGLRWGEVLGLEWKHLQWKAEGGPAVHVLQQRRDWQDVPGALKHGGLTGAFALSEETAELLRAAQRALRARRELLGCASGALVGTRPCADGVVRQYVFPYRDDHTLALLKKLREVAPEEFPAYQGFHRFRRHFGNVVVRHFGVEDGQNFLRHKFVSSTQLYARQVLGVVPAPEKMKKLHNVMAWVLSASHETSDNVEAENSLENGRMAGE